MNPLIRSLREKQKLRSLRQRADDDDEDEAPRSRRRTRRQPEPETRLNAFAPAKEENLLQAAPRAAAAYASPPYSPPLPTIAIPPSNEVAPGIPAREISPQPMRSVFRQGPVPFFAQGDQPYPDMSGQANYSRGQFQQPVQGLVFHHTGGRGDPQGVINTLNQRGLGVHYVMDRDGKVYQTLPSGARGAHMKPSEIGNGLSNANTIGIEVIAADDRDITPAQVEASKQFRDYVAQRYKFDPTNIYGHGTLNKHKQATEGSTIVNALRGLPAASPAPSTGAVAPIFTTTPMPPMPRAVRPQAAAEPRSAWATTAKGDTVDFNQQGQVMPEQRRGPLADRLPPPPVNTTVAPEQRRGPLADRLPGAPPVVGPPPGMAVGPTQWSQQVFNAPAPGANMNVAQALQDQAVREGRMSWAPSAGSGEASPGIGFGGLFGAGAVSSTAAPASSTATAQQGASLADWLTRPGDQIRSAVRGWFS